MATKQESCNGKKDGNIARHDRNSPTQQAKSVLKSAKEMAGKVIQVAISDRTTIELPANLTTEEINERVEKFKKLHH